MKTKEELRAIKEEFENVSKKLQELTAEELEQVTGGTSGESQNLQSGNHTPKSPIYSGGDLERVRLN